MKNFEPQSASNWFIYLFIFSAFVLNSLVFWSYINDDAYITFRYSKNLAEGRGAIYNPGEYVEGYTNFLWMLIFALLIKILPGEAVGLWAKYLGGLFGLGTIFLVLRLGERIQKIKGFSLEPSYLQRGGQYLGGFFLATNFAVGCNSVNMLETSMFTFLIFLAFYRELLQLMNGKEAKYNGLIFGFAAITRPEGYLYFFIAMVARLIFKAGGGRKKLLVQLLYELCLFLFIIVPTNLFRYFYYEHELLPNTYWAKIGGWGSGLLYLWRYLVAYGYMIAVVLIISSLFYREIKPINFYLFTLIVAVFASILRIGGDWMPGYRLIVPVIPFMAILMQEGVIFLFEKAMRGEKTLSRQTNRKRDIFFVIFRPVNIIAIIIVLITFFSFYHGTRLSYYITARALGYRVGHVRLARWLEKQGLKADEKIALMDVGLVGYILCPQPILDITGLTDRHIGKSPGVFLRKDYDPEYIFQQKPKFIILVNGKKPAVVAGGKLSIEPGFFWTSMEEKIYKHTVFQKNYSYVTLFEHFHPGTGYYMLVFTLTGK